MKKAFLSQRRWLCEVKWHTSSWFSAGFQYSLGQIDDPTDRNDPIVPRSLTSNLHRDDKSVSETINLPRKSRFSQISQLSSTLHKPITKPDNANCTTSCCLPCMSPPQTFNFHITHYLYISPISQHTLLKKRSTHHKKQSANWKLNSYDKKYQSSPLFWP